MEGKTNLRALRLRYDIPLSELSAASGLSNQYISRAELGEISPTPRLEDKLGAAVAAGADGLIIEVHNDPQNAKCDGQQSLTPEHFDRLMKKLETQVPWMGKTLSRG